ncbi:MAG: helix-turn-helix transcriptional regulator [Caldilineaceae bacterium]
MSNILPPPSNFGHWLKRLRAQQDLTQEALAELAYCSVQTIRFFESGKRRPSVEMAERLAQVLDVAAAEVPIFIQLARAVP